MTDDSEIQFIPDPYILVRADSKENARSFVGTERVKDVKFHGFGQNKPGKIWEVYI